MNRLQRSIAPGSAERGVVARGLSLALFAAGVLALAGPNPVAACGDFCSPLPVTDTTCYSCELAADDAAQASSDDPGSGDSDGDGLTDGYEWQISATDAYQSDTDGDGLTDGAEVNITGTNPLDPDSEHDGMRDGCDPEPWVYNTGDGDSGALFGEGMGCSLSH